MCPDTSHPHTPQVPSTSRSEDHPESSLWSKRSGPQPLWHTLPLVPRSPITLSCVPFNREVPWLDRRGSSYDLLVTLSSDIRISSCSY